MKKQLFPHICRFITARPVVTVTKSTFFALMAILLLLSLYSIFYPANETLQHIKRQLLIDPTSAKHHLELGILYAQFGAVKQAEEEFAVAQQLASKKYPPDENVLNTVATLLRESQEGKKLLEEKLNYWKKVAREKPDYRDAYIQISAYAYQLKRMEEAKTAIKKALEFDPTFEPAIKLKEIIYAS